MDWHMIYLMRSRMRMRALRVRVWPHFLAGMVAAMIVVILLAGTALAQEIPRDAYEHRRDLMRSWRHVWGLTAPTSTAAAQIHQESAWRPDARSFAGAQGLAQFMPRTADWIGAIDPELSAPAPYDPRWALRAQARYMRHLYERIAGALDDCERMAFALSAYNGGLGWVQRRRAAAPDPSRCIDAACTINPGITAGNQRENERYSWRILVLIEPVYYAHGWGPATCLA
jgi:soluble lytic murein transglycosylase-like protein